MTKISTDKKKIDELLSRGIEEVITADELRKKLLSGKQLRIKLGIDPTSPNLHIGRSIPLLKLRDFQELGHQICFLIGDFTGTIGDTSDKTSERPMLDSATVKKNMKDYVKQAGKILDIKKCEIHYNSKWLKKIGYAELGRQADIFSVNEFISRDNIARRLKDGKRVSLREVLYPLMQGYDSVALKADVEIGGSDQRFNLLAGRELQKDYKQTQQNIITGPLLEGLDGRKMSSSWGNTINLIDSAREMFGKVMSLQDEFLIKYFTLATRIPLSEVANYDKQLKNGINPREIKIALAKALVTMYFDEATSEAEAKYFISTFSKKEMPTDIKKVKVNNYNLLDVLVETGLVASRGEAKRVIAQGGVKVNQSVINDINYQVKSGEVVQKGKINFVEIA